MSTRTRYFMVGAGLILTVGLGTGLAAYYSGELPLKAMRHDAGDLAYVPVDSAIVGHANVRGVMASEFRQHLKQVIPDGSEQQQFEQETGINIERDIDSVTAALGSTSGASDSNLFLIRGAFNSMQVAGYLIQHGGVSADYKGKQVVRTEATKSDGGAIGFLEPGLIALGSEAAIKHAIDGGAAQSVTSNSDMMRLINEAEGRQSTVWAVGRLDKVSQTASLPQAVQDQASAVQWFSVTGDIDGGVSGVVHLEARD